ncbi:MAG TPA: hypothetical protein VMW54_01715 [Terriglobia bacterium]|nr:hypothetical protein [Terriglobia bacterium]
MKKINIVWFILMPGLAMWLGWGIRGQIGHSNGAMIPGAFLALALCILLRGKKFSPGLLIGLTAVGFGFGADMTTMESAGMVIGGIHPPAGSVALGYLGLATKGALWALFGGAGLAMALAASRYRRKDIVLGIIFMVASFYAGWALINRRRFLQLSLVRPEIWAGLLFAGVVLIAWLTVRGHTKIPLVLALCAVVAGAIGYPVAVTLCSAGIHSSIGGVDWWKVAETTFGTFMGVGLGIGTYFLRDQLPDAEGTQQPVSSAGLDVWGVILGVAIALIATALYQTIVPWLLLGSLLWCSAYFSEKLAWHIGVTLTYFGTAANVVVYWVHEQRIGNAAVLWTLAVLTTVVVAWKVTTWWNRADKTVARNSFIFVVWTILILEYLKMFIDRAVVNPTAQALAAAGGRWAYTFKAWGGWGHQFLTNVFFTIVALILTWMAFRTSCREESPGK